MTKNNEKGRLRPWMIAAGAAALLLGLFMAWRAETGGPRLIFIGVDGVSLQTAKGLLAEGKLPALSGLLEDGALVGVVPPSGEDAKAFWAGVFGPDPKTLPQLVEGSGVTTAAVGLPLLESSPKISFVISDQSTLGVARSEKDEPAGFNYLAKTPGLCRPEGLLGELLPALTAPSAIPRPVYEVLLPMNGQDWEDFAKLDTGAREDKFSAAKQAIANDYNQARAAKQLLGSKEPGALFLHFGGGAILSEGISFTEAGFSAALMQLVNLAFYEELRKSYLVLVDRLAGELLEASGPETVVVIVSSPGRGSPMVDEQGGEAVEPEGFMIIAGPGVERDRFKRSLKAAEIAPAVLELLGVKDPA